MEEPIALRVQSSGGTKRIQVFPSDTTADVFEKVYDAFNLNSFEFCLYRGIRRKDEIFSGKSQTIESLGFKHGDTLYMEPNNGMNTAGSANGLDAGLMDTGTPFSSGTSTKQSSPAHTPNSNEGRTFLSSPSLPVVEDEVDQQLSKLDGKIQRSRDPKFCRHGSNASCVHCSSLEPFDETYLKEHNVKHMSFHAYLRKLTTGVGKEKFLVLEDITCKIKEGCKEHPPWPKGICSKCQPNAITLNRQPYRHVDHVMFENPHLVENFIHYWRSTGCQRLGLLYGRYEMHLDVPLGIRAVVAAIYEPPQENEKDWLAFLPDPKEHVVNDIANKLGLKRIGWIFTDLVAEDVQTGTVKYVRGIETHFLSAHECMVAGHLQNLHPNPCKYSPTGYFGSKFITVCVTGDPVNQVHMEGYSVSNQCMALERDDILIPTIDAPELGYIKESTDKQYVPDVYYRETDRYGNDVVKLARQIPVEYLLVDVPISTPVRPKFTFAYSEIVTPFPIENRLVDGHLQDFSALSAYLSQYNRNTIPEAISDFHILLYLATNEAMPLKEHMDPLLEAIKNQDRRAIKEWLRGEYWTSFYELIVGGSPLPPHFEGPSTSSHAPASSSSSSANSDNRASDENRESHEGESGSGSFTPPVAYDNEPWTCPHCTFFNISSVNGICDVCGLPRWQDHHPM